MEQTSLEFLEQLLLDIQNDPECLKTREYYKKRRKVIYIWEQELKHTCFCNEPEASATTDKFNHKYITKITTMIDELKNL